MNFLTKILFFGSLSFSCNQDLTQQKLCTYLISNNIEIKSIDRVLILTERSCIACTKSYASLLESEIDNPRTILIISSKGNYVDISKFIAKKNNKNIIHDFNQKFFNLDIVNNSSAIFLNQESEIDTIVQIKSDSLNSTLSYIIKRISTP